MTTCRRKFLQAFFAPYGVVSFLFGFLFLVFSGSAVSKSIFNMHRDRRATDDTHRSWFVSDEPSPTPHQILRNVFILVKYHPAIEAIQRHGHTNVIDAALTDMPYRNPWLDTRAIFTFGEMIGNERLLLT